MVGSFKRFDIGRRPIRQWRILTIVTWLISFPKMWLHRARIDRSGMPKGLKPPYFLICNHNSFMDFMHMTKAIFPYRAYYVVAIDGFIKREWLLRAVGGIGNRKFVKSVQLVKNMLRARNTGGIVALFPEARYSLCGTSAVLPNSLGKMVRKMNVPVVTLVMHGHHVNSPFWNVGSRKVKPVESEMKLLFTREETQSLTIDELNERLKAALDYDDFAWQKARGVKIKRRNRAEGLHKVLYQCPACNKEYGMFSSHNTLKCGHCGKAWEMDELGGLSALSGETEFSHVPDWYEWQRANVRREVREGRYSFGAKVRVESLPNAKGFITFERPGYLMHNMDGFSLTGVYPAGGEPFAINWPPQSLCSCHIEYDYQKRGDCVDLNTNDDTFYLFPDPEGGDFAVTKIALATEELFSYWNAKRHSS